MERFKTFPVTQNISHSCHIFKKTCAGLNELLFGYFLFNADKILKRMPCIELNIDCITFHRENFLA